MPQEKSFDAFLAAVRDSVETHAKRKGYRRTSEASGPNELADFTRSIQLSDKLTLAQAHAAAECLYKAIEFLHNPRRVHMEKIAGWASFAWAATPADKEQEN